jgi:hypothetical protein
MQPRIELPHLPAILTLAEVADVLRVGVGSIRKQLQAGTFDPPCWGRHPYRWLRVDVEKYLQRQAAVTHAAGVRWLKEAEERRRREARIARNASRDRVAARASSAHR